MAQPNILFIVSDQHAQRALGCYGDGAGITPRLDALATKGVRFDNAYCASPICTPSRAALMTGRQPHRTQQWLNSDILGSGVPTFAHALGAAGYRTTLIGRMHFIGPDQTHGFSERLVGDHSPNWPGNPGFDHGDLSGTAGPDLASVQKSGKGINAYDWKDRDTAAAAVDWLHAEKTRRERGENQPFLLTVGFMLPHPPYVADPEDYEAVAGKVPPVRIPRARPEEENGWVASWRGSRDIATVAEADILRSRQAYWAMVRRLDQHVGQILDSLQEAGLAEDTLVIYTSDHGDHVGERGLFWKHTFFDESAKVPLIMAWPGHLPEGERRTTNVGLTDLGATLSDAASAPWSGDGASLMPLARDASTPMPDEVFSEYCQGVTDPWSAPDFTANRMIRRGRYKLCYYHGFAPQLFDLEDDPDEQVDLAPDPKHSAIRNMLLHRVLADWDPTSIIQVLQARERDSAIMTEWARQTHPPETHRWAMPAGKFPSLED